MTISSPLVSVILPTYNCARFLPEAIESILLQTYNSYEIIVIDDGSTDNTKEILHPFMQRIRYIGLEENKGLPTTRNIGIQSARGEYIAFIDADDLWLPEKLETVVTYFDDHPEVSMVYSRHLNIDEHGHISGESAKKSLPSGNVFIRLFSEQNFILTSTAVVQKKVFETTGMFDESFYNCQDWDMWLRISFYFKVAGINKLLVKYRHNPHSLSKNRDNVLRYQKLVIDKTYQAFKDSKNGISEKLYKKRLALHYAKVGRYHLKNGNKVQARESFRSAIKYDPWNIRTIRYYLIYNL